MDYSKGLRHLVRVALVVGLVVGSVACGDDEDDGTSGQGGASGTGDTGGSSGMGDTGGSGGMGDTGGMGGSGGMMASGGMGGSGGAPTTAMCGTVTCMGPTIQDMVVPACCDEANGNICGARTSTTDPMECTGLMQAGDVVSADVCPRDVKNALEMDAMGCCRPDGKCGFISASLMGCIERSVYPTAFLSAMEPTTSKFPLQTIECSVDADAGM